MQARHQPALRHSCVPFCCTGSYVGVTATASCTREVQPSHMRPSTFISTSIVSTAASNATMHCRIAISVLTFLHTVCGTSYAIFMLAKHWQSSAVWVGTVRARRSRSCTPSVLTAATAGLSTAADTCSNLLPCVRGATCIRTAHCLHPRPGVLCTLVVSAELWSMMCACIGCNMNISVHAIHMLSQKPKLRQQGPGRRSWTGDTQISQEKLQPSSCQCSVL